MRGIKKNTPKRHLIVKQELMLYWLRAQPGRGHLKVISFWGVKNNHKYLNSPHSAPGTVLNIIYWFVYCIIN